MVVPLNIPQNHVGLSREDLIRIYFNEGLKYFEIVVLLMSRHRIKISIRHLKRILKELNLKKRNQISSPREQIIDIIRKETVVSGQCLGYRMMWKRLLKDHGLIVKRKDVMNIMKELYPERTEERKAHKLIRRLYSVKGPNYTWHVDGYDKLKPFGFCIHGCIDGYSRRVLWLEVARTNSNPSVIAKYYLDCLMHTRYAPRIIRSDYGNENSYISFLQPVFRHNANDSLAGNKSFIYGKSTSNQRIEAWWGILRKQGINFWINLFKDLRDCGFFDLDNPVIRECLQFCFMDALQTDLDRIAYHWNGHDIRYQKRNLEVPSGKPDILYFVPELTNGQNYGTSIDVDDVKLCLQLYGKKKEACNPLFKEIIDIVRPNLEVPIHPRACLELFISLCDSLDEYL